MWERGMFDTRQQSWFFIDEPHKIHCALQSDPLIRVEDGVAQAVLDSEWRST